MSDRRPGMKPVEPSLTPDEGWHCSHLYYRLRRDVVSQMSQAQREEACRQIVECLNPEREDAPQRLQTSIVSGHKADFGLMLMDPDPLKVEGVHQRLMATPLGSCLIPS